MSPDAQQLAIATHCGWTDFVFRGIAEPKMRDWVGRHPSVVPEGSSGQWQGQVPDYLGNVEVINRVVRSYLTPSRLARWGTALSEVTGAAIDPVRSRANVRMALATAPERCEAFLKVLELWKNDLTV